jgi:arylsulfatase A-like enzyme
MQENRAILVMGLSFLFSVSAVAQAPADPQPLPSAPNILVIVADDIGVDVLNAYGEGFPFACSLNQDECQSSADCPWGQTCIRNLPPTPTIDGLAANGILFRNVWSAPTCSPTRATIQTGRYGFRTGVLLAYDELVPEEEIIIPEILTPLAAPQPLPLGPGPWVPIQLQQYANAAIGKWHLGPTIDYLRGEPTGANDHGYSHFAGPVYANPLWSYSEWDRSVDGVKERCYVYATTQSVDDALAWIGQQTRPWFMYLAFNAAHILNHAPPDDLHSYHGGDYPDLPVTLPRSRICLTLEGQRHCHQAMVEAMDREMGRLLTGLTPQELSNTTIIFLGDNGTPPVSTAKPFDPLHAKATVFEGGINVPLIIGGSPVQNPGRESAALVNTTDLFATILNLAGIDPEEVLPPDLEIDSVSLMPIIEDSTSGSLRDYVYSENYVEIADVAYYAQTIRNVGGYKLIHQPGIFWDRYQLYYLEDDPFEKDDLYNDLWPNLTPEQRDNLDDLKAQMESLVTSVSPSDGESCQPSSGALDWPEVSCRPR